MNRDFGCGQLTPVGADPSSDLGRSSDRAAAVVTRGPRCDRSCGSVTSPTALVRHFWWAGARSFLPVAENETSVISGRASMI